jgi:CBS domain containing-hemolysin-like protein
VIEGLLPILLLAGALLIAGMLSAGNSAFVNSQHALLKERVDSGQFGATLVLNVAESSTQLLVSMRNSRGAFRLISLGLALYVFSPTYVRAGTLEPLSFIAVLLGSGFILGFVEYLAENLVLRSPEKWAISLVYFVRFVTLTLTPLTWLTLQIGRRFAGQERHQQPLVTEEEIMTLVDAGEEGGLIEQDEKAMIYSIFKLGDTLAREAMVPRIDIVGLDEDTSLSEATDTLLRTGYSRAPVFSKSIDEIVGLVYIKDLLAAWKKGYNTEPITRFMREAYFVPEAMKLDDLLAEMQFRRVHMAVVIDEYGGTAGLVTIEDIVEEIVGEIQDEFDYEEEAAFQVLNDGEYLFTGGIDLDDVNQITGAVLPKDTSETLGGFIYSSLGRVPIHGEVVEEGGLRLVVEQVAGRRIRKVRASRMTSHVLETNDNEAI